MYQLEATELFEERYRFYTKNNTLLKKRIDKALLLLARDPQHPSLHSHKAVSKRFGERWSSMVTGDVRILWDFSPEKGVKVLDVLDLGSHSGKKKVYR